MNVSQRYSDAKVTPIPKVSCFASILLAQPDLCSGFHLMEISPQRRYMQGLSIKEKTDTGSGRQAIGSLLVFFNLAV